MSTPFDTRIDILFKIKLYQERYPQFKPLIHQYDLTFSYAQGVWQKHIELTDKGKEIVNDGWYAMMMIVNQPDNGFVDFADFVNKIVK